MTFLQTRVDNYRASLKKLTAIALISLVLFKLVSSAGIWNYLERTFEDRVSYSIRTWTGHEPEFSDKIKIFVWDDQTTQLFIDWNMKTRTALPFDSWMLIFEAMATRKAKAVLVDMLFTFPYGIATSDAGRQNQLARLNALEIPLVTGAFVSEVENPSGSPLDVNREKYDYEKYLLQNPWFNDAVGKNLWIPYGPIKSLEPGFKQIGHLMQDSNLMTKLFYRIDEFRLLPHWALAVADTIEINSSGLWVNSYQVPMDQDGKASINLINREKILKNAKSLGWLAQQLRDGKAVSEVSEGDYVVILPQFYTGNTDFKETAVGTIEGGLLQSLILNSVVTGSWISRVGNRTTYSFIALMAALILGALLNPVRFVVGVIATVGLFFVGSQALFIGSDIMIPWITPTLTFIITCTFLLLEKVSSQHFQSQKFRNSLRGVLTPRQIEEVMQTPEKFSPSPTTQEVTVMFIDIIGFSILAERLETEEVFRCLKDTMVKLRTIVQEHGGVVDRSLGDGLLCFFGYEYFQGREVKDHAISAVECARVLQLLSARECIEGYLDNKPVFPLRIGINTTVATIGDLGDDVKVDLTLIGRGVNFAQRLEASAEKLMVLVSARTYELQNEVDRLKFSKKRVQIKHYDKLFEAYEFNPFLDDDQDLRKRALDSFFKVEGKERVGGRISLNTSIEQSIRLISPLADGTLLNFSKEGLCLDLDSYLAKGVLIEFELLSSDQEFMDSCRQLEIFPIVGDIAWGEVGAEDRYLHGIRYRNLNERQKKVLFDQLDRVSRDGQLLADD